MSYKHSRPMWLVCFAAGSVLSLGVGAGLYLWSGLDRGISEDPYGVNQLDAPTEPNSDPQLDWPGWMGPNRDGISSQTGLPKTWPANGPEELWRVRGGAGYSGLAVSRGRVFTMLSRGGAEMVVCLDAATGQQIWAARSDSSRPDSYGEGPRATPQVSNDGRAVFTLGANGVLLALEADTGAVIWRRDLVTDFKAEIPRWGVSCSPLLDGDRLLVNVGAASASVVAFAPADGAVLWKSQSDPAGYASPIALTLGGVRQVVQLTATRLVGLATADGRFLWELPYTNRFATNIPTPIWSPEEQLLFISSGYETEAVAVRLQFAKSTVTPVAADDSGSVTFRAETAWSSHVLKNHHSTSVLINGRLYGVHGSTSGVLKCVDLKTGRLLWTDRCLGKGSLIAADGNLYVLGEQGSLALVEANPQSYVERARCQPLTDRCWTPPSLAGGRLYLRNQREIVCLRLKSGP